MSSDTVTEWIKERRRIHDEGHFEMLRDTAIADAHNTLPALLTALEKVLELHFPQFDNPGIDWCWECDKTWPCDTVRAIEGAIK